MGALSRRQLLIASIVGATSPLIGGMSACGQVTGSPCRVTPRQTEGPFYPVEDQLDENSDLTALTGRTGTAEGPIIYVLGTVQDEQCRLVKGARVEIWQASANGRYRHPYDQKNPVPLDQNFQGWGESLSDTEGNYRFKTVHPGQYPAGPGWIRPSHIHFKVSGPGLQELTTQMYFPGDPYLEADRIFRGVPRDTRSQVIATLEQEGADLDTQASVYRFTLTVARAG